MCWRGKWHGHDMITTRHHRSPDTCHLLLLWPPLDQYLHNCVICQVDVWDHHWSYWIYWSMPASVPPLSFLPSSGIQATPTWCRHVTIIVTTFFTQSTWYHDIPCHSMTPCHDNNKTIQLAGNTQHMLVINDQWWTYVLDLLLCIIISILFDTKQISINIDVRSLKCQ